MTRTKTLSEMRNMEYRLIANNRNNQINIKTNDRLFGRHSTLFSPYLRNRNAEIVSSQKT